MIIIIIVIVIVIIIIIIIISIVIIIIIIIIIVIVIIINSKCILLHPLCYLSFVLRFNGTYCYQTFPRHKRVHERGQGVQVYLCEHGRILPVHLS